jgi:hypothetical protein
VAGRIVQELRICVVRIVKVKRFGRAAPRVEKVAQRLERGGRQTFRQPPPPPAVRGQHRPLRLPVLVLVLDERAAAKPRRPGRVVHAFCLRGRRGRPLVRGLPGPRRSTAVCNGWSPDRWYRTLWCSSHLVVPFPEAPGTTTRNLGALLENHQHATRVSFGKQSWATSSRERRSLGECSSALSVCSNCGVTPRRGVTLGLRFRHALHPGGAAEVVGVLDRARFDQVAHAVERVLQDLDAGRPRIWLELREWP